MTRKWTVVGTAPDGFEYQFEINPNEQGSPFPSREITWTHSRTGFTGTRAGRGPHSWDFSGVLRSKEQFDAMLNLVSRKDRLRLTDDRGDTFLIKVVAFKPEQQAGYRWKTAPYRQTYSMSVLVYPEEHLNEDFELVSHLTVGETNDFERMYAARKIGKRGLRMTRIPEEVGVYSQVTAPRTYRAPIKASVWMRTVTGAGSYDEFGHNSTGLPALCFNVPTAVGKLGYQATMDIRPDYGGMGAFQLRRDYDSFGVLTQFPMPISWDQWYLVEVELRNEAPRITARVLSDHSTPLLLAEITSSDDFYTQGRIGVSAYSTSDFDLLKTEPLA